jgi:hypothetical protein
MSYITLYTLFDFEFADIRQKLATFSHMLGILNNTFEPTLFQKFSRIKVYNALALPIVYMEAKFGPLRHKDKKAIDINRDESFQRSSPVHPFYHNRNEEILEELKVEPVDKNLRRYKSNWLRHVPRKNNSRMPKIILNCRPNG